MCQVRYRYDCPSWSFMTEQAMMGYDDWRHIWTPSPSFWFQKSHWLDHKNLFRSTISEVLDLRSPAGSRLDSSDRLSQFRAILGGRRDLMINSSKQYTPTGDLSSLFNRKSRHADPREGYARWLQGLILRQPDWCPNLARLNPTSKKLSSISKMPSHLPTRGIVRLGEPKITSTACADTKVCCLS